MGDNYAAMLALWFLVAIVEIGYLVFKYFFEIKLAMEEEKLFYRKEASQKLNNINASHEKINKEDIGD